MEGHSEGVKQDQFCALRKETCPCGNTYQTNCKDPDPNKAPKWDYFVQGRKQRVAKNYEAHHLLCIASVTQFIGKKKEILDIVKQTQWCINTEKNMLAMPLWGHTIKWYCDISLKGILKDQDEAPPFKNLPHHDYDHNSKLGYKKAEVDTELQKLADQIQKIAKNHEVAIKELKKELDNLSDRFRRLLRLRGTVRCGGTHNAWKNGEKRPDDWYLPFSMASSGAAEKRTFPTIDDAGTVANKIRRLVEALGKWGA